MDQNLHRGSNKNENVLLYPFSLYHKLTVRGVISASSCIVSAAVVITVRLHFSNVERHISVDTVGLLHGHANNILKIFVGNRFRNSFK